MKKNKRKEALLLCLLYPCHSFQLIFLLCYPLWLLSLEAEGRGAIAWSSPITIGLLSPNRNKSLGDKVKALQNHEGLVTLSMLAKRS